MKAKSTFILKIISKNTKWQNMQKIPIWNVKSVISSIQILAWKCLGCQKKQKSSRNWHVLSNCAVFEPKSNKLRKSIKTSPFPMVFGHFWRFFEPYWNLAGKQRNLTTNSSSLSISASSDTPIVPRQRFV